MVKKLFLILIIGFTAFAAQADTQPANYDNAASTEETVGFISFALLGAAAGGPPGAIVGGAIGAMVGDGWHGKKQVGDLQANLYGSQLELAALREEANAIEEQYRVAQAELDRYRSAPPQVLPASLATQPAIACCDNTVTSIHFRTGSSGIEPHYQEQLESLANLAAQMANATVEITGYADRNGDSNRNLQLSRQRSESVKDFFSDKGIENASITTIAYGESRPLQATQSFESDFFDRRVIVRLKDNNQSMLTQTPDDK